MKSAAFISASLLLLAGCDTLAVRATGTPLPLYRVEDPSYVGQNRDFHIVVIEDGATLGGHEPLQAALIDGMQRNARFTTHFTTAPQTHNPEYRVVLMFNPAATVQSRDLCRLPLAPLPFSPSRDDSHLQGAFCRLGEVLSEADAYTSGIKTAGDSRFRALMTAFAQQIFPSRDMRPEETPE